MSTRSGSSTSPHGINQLLVKRSYSTPCEHDMNDTHSSSRNNNNKLKTPPLTPSNKNNNKMFAIKVLLLEDTVTLIQAQAKALGRLVFDQVCKQLNVLEADYFGLEYVDDNGVTYWLDLEKRLTRQVGLNMSDPMLKFSVKFYTPDPSQLEEEYTRYLFSLQIKRDLATGVLQCNDNTAALMASFIVQAECGDFSEDDYPDAMYLSVYKFVPHQNYELERKIRENHKKHIGQSPAEADLHLLETARRTELYGVRVHPAKDEDGVSLNLSVCHMGILVFQNMTKINTFSWAKIRKISFKRKRFILKLHPETYFQEGYYKELVEFIFDSRNECKAYWKRCVEHHAFFRCEKAPNPIHRSKGILSSRGSSFRYSGRTQKQMVAFVRENFIKRPNQQQYHSMSQQNLSTMGGLNSFEFNNQQQQQLLQFQRSSSFKSSQQQQQARNYERGILGSQQVVSNSRSSPAMITTTNDERIIQSNYDELEDDNEEDEEEEFSDYVVENNTTTKKKKHPPPQQQDDNLSMTSSPIRAEAASSSSGQEKIIKQKSLDELEVELIKELMRDDDVIIIDDEFVDEKNDEYEESEEEFIKKPKLIGYSHEFPVTTYKTPQKVSLTNLHSSSPTKIVSRKTRKQRRSKSLVRVEFDDDDDDDEEDDNNVTKRIVKCNTLPRVGNKINNKKVDDQVASSQGSYDLLEVENKKSFEEIKAKKKSIHFPEVDIPYLLRRRIELDSKHEVLAKSKSYGGTTTTNNKSKYYNEQQQTHNIQKKRLVSFCSMQDLPPINNFSWRDDSIDSSNAVGGAGAGGGSLKNFRYSTGQDFDFIIGGDSADPFSHAVKESQQLKKIKVSSCDSLDKIEQDEVLLEEEKKIDIMEVDEEEEEDEIEQEVSAMLDERVQLGSLEDIEEEKSVKSNNSEEQEEQNKNYDYEEDEQNKNDYEEEQQNEDDYEEDEQSKKYSEEEDVIAENYEDIIQEISDDNKEEEQLEEEETTTSNNQSNQESMDKKEEELSETLVVAESLVSSVLEEANEVVKVKKLDRRDSVQKMQSLDGIEELPYDTIKINENEIIIKPQEEEEEETSSISSENLKKSTTEVKKELIEVEELPPPPPLRNPSGEEEEEELIECETPRFPPPLGDFAGSRRSSYDNQNSTTISDQTMIENKLKKALMRSFSIAEEEVAPTIPIRISSISADSSSNNLNKLSELDEIEFIDKSEPLYDTVVNQENSELTNSLSNSTTENNNAMLDNIIPEDNVIMFKTRFRTLSRISERTHSSYTNTTNTTANTSQFMEKIEKELKKKLEQDNSNNTLNNAPLVTITTSELGDSSATLNDLEDIQHDDDFYVEGIVLDQVQEAEIVSADDNIDNDNDDDVEEEERCSLNSSTNNSTTMRKRVCIQLQVVHGEIVFDDNNQVESSSTNNRLRQFESDI